MGPAAEEPGWKKTLAPAQHEGKDGHEEMQGQSSSTQQDSMIACPEHLVFVLSTAKKEVARLPLVLMLSQYPSSNFSLT